MSAHSKWIVFGAAGLLLAALPVLAKTPQKAKPKAVPVETAVIENTGSTNTTGYQITVTSTGSAHGDGKAMTVPAAMSRQLFHDLAAAMPLDELPARRGMRSASFGAQTFVTYNGKQSPDLTFGGDARVAALKADIEAITQAMHVGSAPRRPMPRRLVMPPPQN